MTRPFQEETSRCREAQSLWARRDVSDRLKPVGEFRSLLVEERQALLEAVEADVGRPPQEVTVTDLLTSAAAAKFLLTDARRLLAPRRPGRRPLWLFGTHDTIFCEPHGLVGLIATWNYPIFLTAVPILQALTAGNGVLWKPSEQTPRTAEVLGKLFTRAGFPAELIQRLPATREAGPELIEADIDFVHFTGSDAVGRKLAIRLAERLIPSVLELSGVDALIVLKSADLEMAARTAWYGTTLNRGQTCLATRRVFVDRSVTPQFVELLKPLVETSIPVRLQTAGQLQQHRQLLADARQHGAEVLSGKPADNDTVSPSAILAKDANLAICRQATFSPILAVIPFENGQHAIELHNQCPFGLGASVFAGSEKEAEFIAHHLRCGAVVINDVIVSTAHPATPFTGRGQSGWGPTQGAEGLLAMIIPKVISVRGGRFRPHVDSSLKPDPQLGPMMEGLLLASHSRSYWDRLKGFWQLIRNARS